MTVPWRIRAELALAALAIVLAACVGSGSPGSTDDSHDGSQKTARQQDDTRRKASEAEDHGEGGDASHRDDRADAPSTDEGEVRVTVRGSRVRGPEEVRMALGEPVRIEVAADTSDHLHVHGYDEFADVAPGRPAMLRFEADIPGAFEVELEDSHLLLFELVVR